MKTDASCSGAEGTTLATSVREWLGTTWLAVGALALLAAVCCTPLMHPGWFTSHEQIRPIARALFAWHEIAAGDPYPRWLSEGYLGRGMPLFNFYPPAFSLVVAYAHALGVPFLLGTKVFLYLLFFCGALGTFLWVRPHLGHFPALTAAILYLYAPYHFVDLYVRGATAEFTALAVFPFLFLGVDMLVDRFSARGVATLALASAAIVLSHFLGALMIAPFALAYVLARAWPGGGGAALGRVALGGTLGAALSAFFWLPALAELDGLSTARVEASHRGYSSPFIHFVQPQQWFKLDWGFGASAPEGFADGMSFQIGLLLVIAVGASTLLSGRLGKAGRTFVLTTLGLGLGALWLTSPASRLWYVWLRPFQQVQFPWRFLGPVTLFLSAAGAGFVLALSQWRKALGPSVAGAVAVLAVIASTSQRQVEDRYPIPDERAAIAAVVAGDQWSAKFGNDDEFLPRDGSVEVANAEPGQRSPWGLGVEISSVRARRGEVKFDVVAHAEPAVVVVPWHVFPGWEVSLDGRDWPLLPGPDGLIAFTVPEGRHVAHVRFGTTLPRVVGWVLAVAGTVTLGALVVRERTRRRRPPA